MMEVSEMTHTPPICTPALKLTLPSCIDHSETRLWTHKYEGIYIYLCQELCYFNWILTGQWGDTDVWNVKYDLI